MIQPSWRRVVVGSAFLFSPPPFSASLAKRTNRSPLNLILSRDLEQFLELDNARIKFTKYYCVSTNKVSTDVNLKMSCISSLHYHFVKYEHT